jgi:hypothetical protein
MDRIKQLQTVHAEALELFKKKNADYGDAFANYGPVGVLVRMGDKISRLQSISATGVNLVEGEKLRDTLIDLHNYSAMAIMLMDENASAKGIEVSSKETDKLFIASKDTSQEEVVERIMKGEVVRFTHTSE